MTVTLTQGAEFLAALYGGMLTGLLFDLFRPIHLLFRRFRIVHAAFDLLFYAAAGVLIAHLLLSLSGGAVRAYHFLGIGAGVFLQQAFLFRPIQKLLWKFTKKFRTAGRKSRKDGEQE